MPIDHTGSKILALLEIASFFRFDNLVIKSATIFFNAALQRYFWILTKNILKDH